MDGLFVLVGLGLLSLPLLAIAAFVRSGSIRRELEEQSAEYRSILSLMESEIATLKKALAKMESKVSAHEAPFATAVEEPAEPAKAVVEAVTPASPAPFVPKVEAPKKTDEWPTPQPSFYTQPAKAEAVAAPGALKETVPAMEAPDAPASPVPTPWAAASPVETVATTGTASMAGLRKDSSRAAEPPPPPPPPPFTRAAEARSAEPEENLRTWLGKHLPLEEILGMNLFAKIGIVLLVLGFALLGRVALIAMGPVGKVALLYAASCALLGGGMWLERKERYRLIGRTGIGGGWALFFFTTYAMNHVAAMHVMASETFNCVLLLLVA
ncbi:MAG TPA: DUF2339 domain-containing protein, partial [Candidatus Angelobacter sp.]|nr:DUF2339 domain-containing protein [Candidatus Angelobacter sp.]